MGDMFDNSCSSPSSQLLPSSSTHPGASGSEQDELSLFLHQILLRSSSSSLMVQDSNQMQNFSSSLSRPENRHCPCQPAPVSGSNRLVQEESSSGVNAPPVVGFSASEPYFSVDMRPNAVNVSSSSSAGAFENDFDEYDCESEEGLEALVEEATKPVPHRGSSKRSRAAEVHNLSEKRRRSRINEKMKALQNLIPNSNKTDKASMLDEAIEYLKQLQLQVQMLSMRNGLSLQSMCLPGALQPVQLSQMRMGFGDGNGSVHMDMTSTHPVNQDTSRQTTFNQPPNHSTSSVPNMSHIINSETSFGLESSIQPHLRPFQLHTSSEGICREDMLHQQLSINRSETNPLEHDQPHLKRMPGGRSAAKIEKLNF